MRMFSLRVSMLFLVVVFVFGSLSFASSVHADSPPLSTNDEIDEETGAEVVTVATVNVTDPVLIEHTDNVFTIAFNISNREGVQPSVPYAVNLLRQEGDGEVIADRHIYREDSLNLGNNENIHKVVTYIAPAYLRGEYTIQIEAKNQDAMTFGFVNLQEKVVLEGTLEHIQTSPTQCFLTVSSDVKGEKYSINEGVDITSEETLTAHCSVKSLLSADQEVSPIIRTYHRSVYGKLMSEETLDARTVQAGKDTLIEFILPKPSQAQAYDASFTLIDTKGVEVSAPVELHYVLRGESATIQNLTLDKDAYVSGEKAKVNFFWTGDVGGFMGSRFGIPSESKKIASVFTIVNNRHEVCASRKIDLDTQYFGGEEYVLLDVTQDCLHPVITTAIVDEDGKTLAENTYTITSKQSKKSLAKAGLFARENAKSTLAAAFILFIILIFLVYVFKNNKRLKTKFFVGILIGAGFLGANDAHADSFTFNTAHKKDIVHIYFTAGVDKGIYTTGENIVATRTYSDAICANTGNSVKNEYSLSVNATINGLKQNIPNNASVGGFTAEGVPGTYNAMFHASVTNKADGYNMAANRKVAYKVINPAVAPTLSLEKNQTIAQGDSATLSWVSNTGNWCIKSGSGWSGQLSSGAIGVGVSGSQSVSPSSTSVYSLACQDEKTNKWSPSRSVTVTVLPASSGVCTGSLGVGGSYYPGDDTGLLMDTPKKYGPNTSAKCEFSCLSGSVYNAATQTCDIPSGGPVAICTGATPSGAVLHTNAAPAVNTPKSYSASGSAPCTFYCASGIWNSATSSCVAATPPPVCNAGIKQCIVSASTSCALHCGESNVTLETRSCVDGCGSPTSGCSASCKNVVQNCGACASPNNWKEIIPQL